MRKTILITGASSGWAGDGASSPRSATTSPCARRTDLLDALWLSLPPSTCLLFEALDATADKGLAVFRVPGRLRHERRPSRTPGPAGALIGTGGQGREQDRDDELRRRAGADRGC